jgi:hypothetical protein
MTAFGATWAFNNPNEDSVLVSPTLATVFDGAGRAGRAADRARHNVALDPSEANRNVLAGRKLRGLPPVSVPRKTGRSTPRGSFPKRP